MSNPLFLLFLGSLLTFIASSLVEYLKDSRKESKSRRSFYIFVGLTLKAVSKNLDKLKDRLEDKNFFDFQLLDSAESTLKLLQENRSRVVLFESELLQEKFYDIVSDLSLFFVGCRSNQNTYYGEKERLKTKDSLFTNEKAIEDWFKDVKTSKQIELIELKRRIDDFIREIGA